MKKYILILIINLIVASVLCADVVLPYTGFVVKGDFGQQDWIMDDRTEFAKKKALGIIDVPNPVLNNVYLTPEENLGKKGECFSLINECSGMGFIFSWSAVRVMAIRETRNEMKRFYDMHVKSLGGTRLRIIKEMHNNKTGEFYIRYSWKMKDGTVVNGYTASTFYKQDTLVTVTIEWVDEEGELKARDAFNHFKEEVSLNYDIHI